MLMVTLPRILEKSAKKFPRRICLIFGKKKISYSNLNGQIDKLSRSLVKLKIDNRSKTAILLKNSPEYIISYFAVLKAGAVVIPLNNMLKTEELKFILEDSKASIIITSPEFIEMSRQLRLQVDSLKKIITTDSSFPDSISFSALIADAPAVHLSQPAGPEDIACILYTSGTTGRPKGVMLTHHNLISNAATCTDLVKVSRRDNFLCLLPMFHSFTIATCILMPIYTGARITIVESVRPFSKIIKAIITRRVTVFIAVPPIYNILSGLKIPRILRWPVFRLFNPLKLCISGADALPAEVLDKFEAKFKIPLLEGYGLTEASPVVSFNPLKGKRKAGSIGLPIPGVEVRIVDEKNNILPAGRAGELLVKGPNVMKGYFNLPAETSQAVKNGWLYTGDIAKKDEDGYLYIVDRKKDLIIVRGLNVYPREIENILYRHSAVSEAAVIGVKDTYKGEVVKAVIALKQGRQFTEREIISFCRNYLASYKIPRSIEFRDTLPKTSTGKILKRSLN